MKLTYVPVLRVQREIQSMPRGMERFRHYLDTMTSDAGDDLVLPPLAVMNPMGKENVTAALDRLLAMDADAIASDACDEASRTTAAAPGDFNATIMVADELGGWTNRWTWEHDLRFGPQRLRTRSSESLEKRFWVTGVLWSLDDFTPAMIREAILTSAYRAEHTITHGHVRTLRDMLVQEGAVLAKTGAESPMLSDDELDYTRQVIAPFLDSTEMAHAVECLFGDEAARVSSFTPRGLSAWAGIALALREARSDVADAE